MQPAYLPWAGYFNLIAAVDVFVFFDDVQYIKREWINRNRILLDGAAHWLSVPVQGGPRDMLIADARTDESQPWRRRHLQSLLSVYGRHLAGPVMIDIVEQALGQPDTTLAGINIGLVQAFAERLGLRTRFVRASTLACDGKRSTRLMNVCRALDCDRYLSPAGAADYLAEDGVFAGSPVALEFQQCEVASYPQRGATEFVSHLSIVDVVANLGFEEALRYIKGLDTQAIAGATP